MDTTPDRHVEPASGAPEPISVPIPVRDLDFPLDPVAMRHWHGAGKAVTNFYDNLSIFFPAGERFFVASVNAHKDAVRDEKTRAEVRAFCGQEGLHTREHLDYNRMLEAQGYPALKLEGRVEKLLRWVTRLIPARRRLSATCALEHFTATLAHVLLSDPRVLEGAHPTMAALWTWHAVEENEHKAVAWDVYQAAGGGLIERTWVMLLATVIFWGLVVDHQVRFMWRDRILFSPREWGRLIAYCWWRPGHLWKMARHYVDYFRPTFHPWMIDNRALLASWQREYATSPAYLQARKAHA